MKKFDASSEGPSLEGPSLEALNSVISFQVVKDPMLLCVLTALPTLATLVQERNIVIVD